MSKKNELDELLAGKISSEKSVSRPTPAAVAPRRSTPDEGGEQWIDIDLLHDNPNQPGERNDDAELLEMKKSFDADGQLQAALARPHPTRPNHYQLAFGHRRKYTVKMGANAGIKEPNPQSYIGKLRVRVQQISDLEMLRYALVENNERMQFSPLQNARLYVRLREATTAEMLLAGEKPMGEKDESGAAQASWRQVVAWNKFHDNKYSDMQRVSAILDLPPKYQEAFSRAPYDRAGDHMVLNSRHARALLKFLPSRDADEEQKKADAKRLKSLFEQIQREKLTGTQADQRADDIKKMQPTPLELETTAKREAAAEKAEREKAAQSRAAALEDNVRALRRGVAHLGMVKDDAPQAGSTPTAAITTARRDAPPIPATSKPEPQPTAQTTAFNGAHLNHWSAAAEYLNRALRELGECKAADLEVARENVKKIRAINDEVDARLYQLDKEIDDFEAYLNLEPSREKAKKNEAT